MILKTFHNIQYTTDIIALSSALVARYARHLKVFRVSTHRPVQLASAVATKGKTYAAA